MRLPSLAAGWRWAPYVSFPRWAYEALVILFFADRSGGDLLLEAFGFDGFGADPDESVRLACTILVGYYLALQARRPFFPEARRVGDAIATVGSQRKKK